MGCEVSMDRTLRLMRAKRRRDDNLDRGNLLGIGEIKQMVGGDREAVRGDLIALVARGDVEVLECINGTYWRAAINEPVIIVEPIEKDGSFILQREVMEGTRTFWFDAETFTSSKRARAALEFARRDKEAESRRRYHDGLTSNRTQRIRLLKLEGE